MKISNEERSKDNQVIKFQDHASELEEDVPYIHPGQHPGNYSVDLGRIGSRAAA